MTKRIVDLDNNILFMLQIEVFPVHKDGKIDYVNPETKLANLKKSATNVDFLIPSDKKRARL